MNNRPILLVEDNPDDVELTVMALQERFALRGAGLLARAAPGI